MPASRAVRALCRECGPLAAAGLHHADGRALSDPGDVTAWCSGDDIALVLHGGTCRGPEPTVVDCTVSPPVVRHVGALPESFVDAALMMGRRRRRWRANRDPAAGPG
jgi:tRNA A37 threonylcarbamoyladenosine synthetase subunit TsaC/SUA5/YrdC